jgi:cbb3-type cytochrome oxidase subunit 3
MEGAGKSTVQFALGSMLFFILFAIASLLVRAKRVRANANKYIRLPEDDVEVRETLFASLHRALM